MSKFKLLDTVRHKETGGQYRILGVPSQTKTKSMTTGQWHPAYIYTGINGTETSTTFVRPQFDMEAKFEKSS